MGIDDRRGELGPEDEEADVGQTEADVEQQRVEEIAGLEQRPHGQHRSEPGVSEKDPGPTTRRGPAHWHVWGCRNDDQDQDEFISG